MCSYCSNCILEKLKISAILYSYSKKIKLSIISRCGRGRNSYIIIIIDIVHDSRPGQRALARTIYIYAIYKSKIKYLFDAEEKTPACVDGAARPFSACVCTYIPLWDLVFFFLSLSLSAGPRPVAPARATCKRPCYAARFCRREFVIYRRVRGTPETWTAAPTATMRPRLPGERASRAAVFRPQRAYNVTRAEDFGGYDSGRCLRDITTHTPRSTWTAEVGPATATKNRREKNVRAREWEKKNEV